MNAIKRRYSAFKEKRIPLTLFLFLVSVAASGLLSPYITIYAREGILLCFNAIIGSVFPFLLLTDIVVSMARFENIAIFRYLFEKLFNINGYAISAFIIGAVCGFPLGVKVASDLYGSKAITKEECERLIGFSNNTGPAFVISGIGAALRGSLRDGVILYISMITAAIAVGIILGVGKTPSKTNIENSTYPQYSFTKSVSSATHSTMNICGYIILFSVICGILTFPLGKGMIYSFSVSFIEVSNAAKILATASSLSESISLILTSFAISFSGISVHMQAKSFLYGTDISMNGYYKSKLIQGIISAVITAVIITII